MSGDHDVCSECGAGIFACNCNVPAVEPEYITHNVCCCISPEAVAALKEKAMTKDELEAAATAIAIARGRYWENTREDIIELAQAHTDAALADTLGLAEEIVKRGLHIYLSTNNGALHVYEENDGLDRLMFYWQGNKRLDRAEAEALLAGEEEKE